jgi:hypothetical protein
MSTLAAACTMIMVVAVVQADTQVVDVQAVDSARLRGDSNWGCCSADIFQSAPSTLYVKQCSTMGGYCMGGKSLSAWIFDMPAMPQGSTVQSTIFTGGCQSTSGIGSLSFRWLGNESLSTSSILSTYNNPNVSTSINWPSGQSYSFVLPPTVYANGMQPRIMVVASKLTTSTTTLTNSGAYAPVLRVVLEVPELACPGDMTGDLLVDTYDFSEFLIQYGNSGANLSADIDGDQDVDIDDFSAFLINFGNDCNAPTRSAPVSPQPTKSSRTPSSVSVR